MGSMPTLTQKSLSLPSTAPWAWSSSSSASSASMSTFSSISSVGRLLDLGFWRRLCQLGGCLLGGGSSTSGMVMTSSMASTTLSQLRPIADSISAHRLRPMRPSNVSMPPPSVPRHWVSVEEFVDRGQLAHRPDGRRDGQRPVQSLHRLLAGLFGGQFRDADDVVLALLAGIQRCALASVIFCHAGWSVRSLSLVGPDEGRQILHRLEGVEVLVLAEERLPFVAVVAPARAHSVYRSPLVNPSRIGTMSAAMAHSLTTAPGDLDGHPPRNRQQVRGAQRPRTPWKMNSGVSLEWPRLHDRP